MWATVMLSEYVSLDSATFGPCDSGIWLAKTGICMTSGVALGWVATISARPTLQPHQPP